MPGPGDCRKHPIAMLSHRTSHEGLQPSPPAADNGGAGPTIDIREDLVKSKRSSIVILLLSLPLLAQAATAGVSPHVRVGFCSNRLRLTDLNNNIMLDQADIRAGGLPADFYRVGNGYGPEVSAGLWLLPAFRVGATYSFQKATRENYVHVPGELFYDDVLTLRVKQIGGEAAIRFARLRGLSVGAEITQARAQINESYSVETYGWQNYEEAEGHRTQTSYGAYLGLDQVNPHGVAGFVRAGYRFRDIGHMPLQGTTSDGSTTVAASGPSVWMDYSGFYLTVGSGFDWKH